MSIDEEWEEIADDYSVVSMQSSDDEDGGSPVASPREPASPSGQSSFVHLDDGEAPPDDGVPASADTTVSPADTKTVSPADTTPVSPTDTTPVPPTDTTPVCLADTVPVSPAATLPSIAQPRSLQPRAVPVPRKAYIKSTMRLRPYPLDDAIASDDTRNKDFASEPVSAAGLSTETRKQALPPVSAAGPPASQQGPGFLDLMGTPQCKPQFPVQVNRDVPKKLEGTSQRQLEKEVLFIRHKMQKALLTRDHPPIDEDMPAMSDFLAKLEAKPDLDVSIIRFTKINKVLKAMLKLDSIPRDDEFKLKDRSRALLEEWTSRLNGHIAAAFPTVSTPPVSNRVRDAPPTETTRTTEQGLFGLNKLSVQPGTHDVDASVKKGGPLGESLDFDESSSDPILIHTALQSLGDAIQKTSRLTVGLRQNVQQNQREVTEIESSCQTLLSQINELSPILAEYGDHWTKSITPRKDIPVDPSLLLWMSSLSSVVSEAQRKIELTESQHGYVWGMKGPNYLDNVCRALSDHSRQMDDFLPIMRIDFNDWRTKNLSFPSETTEPRQRVPSEFRHVDQLPRIRNAMYELQDEIQRAIGVLGNCQSSLPTTASNTATEVLRSLGSVLEAVSRALTNNGSEWIESDFGATRTGFLSHNQFSSLDPSTIEDLTTRIKQISDLVYIDPVESRRWSAYMVRQHHTCMLVEQQQLDALETIAAVLKEIMMPNRMVTRTEFAHFLREM